MSSSDLAPWRSPLSRALHRNRAQPVCRFLQLATIRPEGSPANRTVVFRGFRQETNQLMFISDRRSEKIVQIRQNPSAEACWYFTKTREQFRLRGQLMIITADTVAADLGETRRQLWQKISDSARLQFAWPTPKATRNPDSDAFEAPEIDSRTPPDTFCVLLLLPEEVDYLCLRGEPQDRIIYHLSKESWTVTSVNP
ncbi:pyridoxamine 5'-phosphate oxidase family protein [Synechococcus sp. PCC 7335]|uniref:Npun_F5749 family FMN-dependent PPOX-type flavoprotein n=1 Tax=Synechococcus sp. (strain ATCC 29403 / PCC 7335) TaxID=91464 RepID=UPI00017ECE87|nr:Npun_F5749 family FMN-dependent PPOX-type flavoprotein [Synechococcus sp. PCC 7335]EDX85295.1 pyridoxamine 5'-phosphate oxidase family protein [Synechococcus sp. PCC 7335]